MPRIIKLGPMHTDEEVNGLKEEIMELKDELHRTKSELMDLRSKSG